MRIAFAETETFKTFDKTYRMEVNKVNGRLIEFRT